MEPYVTLNVLLENITITQHTNVTFVMELAINVMDLQVNNVLNAIIFGIWIISISV